MTKIEKAQQSKRAATGRYVTFTDAGVSVDVGRFLKTSNGQKMLNRIEKVSEKFAENAEKKRA